MKLIIPFLLVWILATSTTCNKDIPPKQTQNVIPTNTTWQLESMTLSGKKSPVFDASLHIGKEKVTGHGGCNRFFGSYTMSGNRITISKIGATRMYCDKNAFERAYLSALEKVTEYQIKENQLVLSLPEGTLIFSPQGKSETVGHSAFQNTQWHLQSISQNGVSTAVSTDITLLFKKNKFSGNGGCNSYFGRYAMRDNRLAIRDIGATEMYCEKTSKLEMEYLDALKNAKSYSFENGHLVLNFEDKTGTTKGQLIFK